MARSPCDPPERHGPRAGKHGRRQEHDGIDPDRSAEQEQAGEQERHRPAGGEDADPRDEQLRDEQTRREDEQDYTGRVHREDRERREGENEQDHADDRPAAEPRVRELVQDRERADRDEQEREVRVGEPLQHAPREPELHLHELGSGGPERHVPARVEFDDAPVESLQQLDAVAGEQLHDAELECLVRRHRAALAHRVDRELHVAAALFGDRFGVRSGVVDHLLRQVAALEVDRRRGADRGAGRHRGDVGGQSDDRAGRGRARPLRRHVHDDGHARVQERLDDVAHRRVEPAGRVELDQERLVPFALGEVEGVADVVGDHRRDDAVDLDDDDAADALRVRGRVSGEEQACDQQQPRRDAPVAGTRRAGIVRPHRQTGHRPTSPPLRLGSSPFYHTLRAVLTAVWARRACVGSPRTFPEHRRVGWAGVRDPRQ
jgi:hypothetical protein